MRTRRSQSERTEETRSALIEAAIRVLYKGGYNAATTAAIADEAGISRGSIIYHFSTRAQLMSDVLTFVYEQDQLQYDDFAQRGFDLTKTADWPLMLWNVLSQPSGVAVLEILQASRSDSELAALVLPTQRKIEQASVEAILQLMPERSEEQVRATVRLFVWATRGLVLSAVLAQDQTQSEHAVKLFRHIVQEAVREGALTFPGDL